MIELSLRLMNNSRFFGSFKFGRFPWNLVGSPENLLGSPDFQTRGPGGPCRKKLVICLKMAIKHTDALGSMMQYKTTCLQFIWRKPRTGDAIMCKVVDSSLFCVHPIQHHQSNNTNSVLHPEGDLGDISPKSAVKSPTFLRRGILYPYKFSKSWCHRWKICKFTIVSCK